MPAPSVSESTPFQSEQTPRRKKVFPRVVQARAVRGDCGQGVSRRFKRCSQERRSGTGLTCFPAEVVDFSCAMVSLTKARRVSASKVQERRYAETVRPASAARLCSCAHSSLLMRMVTLAFLRFRSKREAGGEADSGCVARFERGLDSTLEPEAKPCSELEVLRRVGVGAGGAVLVEISSSGANS